MAIKDQQVQPTQVVRPDPALAFVKAKPHVPLIPVELFEPRAQPVVTPAPAQAALVCVAPDRVEIRVRAQVQAEAVYAAPVQVEAPVQARVAAVDRAHVVMIRNRALVRPRSVRPLSRRLARHGPRKPVPRLAQLVRPQSVASHNPRLAQHGPRNPVQRLARHRVRPLNVQNANATNATPILTSPEPG